MRGCESVELYIYSKAPVRASVRLTSSTMRPAGQVLPSTVMPSMELLQLSAAYINADDTVIRIHGASFEHNSSLQNALDSPSI